MVIVPAAVEMVIKSEVVQLKVPICEKVPAVNVLTATGVQSV